MARTVEGGHERWPFNRFKKPRCTGLSTWRRCFGCAESWPSLSFCWPSLAATGDTWAADASHSEKAREVVVAAALKSTVPPELALAVAQVGGQRWSHERDYSEAVGVMGIRPALARAEFGVGSYNLRRTSANAGLGVALLERLHQRYDGRWDLALSHYRGGPLGRCGNESVVHMSTIDYVADVLGWWRTYQDDERIAALIEQVSERGFRRDRFSVDDNTFLSTSRREGFSKDEWFPTQDEESTLSGGAWFPVVEGAARFRSGNHPLFRFVRSNRFF